MNHSVSSPIYPRRIIVSLDETGYRDLVDENTARVAPNNPEISPDVVASAPLGAHKTLASSRGGPTSSPGNHNRIPSLRMPQGGDRDSGRSALAPRTSETINGSILEKKYATTKPVVSNAMTSMPPLSEGPRWRGGSTPPRPNTTQQIIRPVDTDRPRIPKHTRDTTLSPKLRGSSSSIASQKSSRSAPVPVPPPDWQWDPESQEQALFEQRLCEDAYGVAVRKINQNGRAQLRYVKCVALSVIDDDNGSSSKSVSSLVRTFSLRSREKRRSEYDDNSDTDKLLSDVPRKALVWGKKKDHTLAIDQFVSVRIGKTTDRTRRNPQPPSRLLSLITKDGSLDIEAPTRLDRDKFACAFARFLRVPLEGSSSAEGMYPAFLAVAGQQLVLLTHVG